MNITPELTKLNLGCGFRKLEDHWNVDIESICNPDQVLDMDQTPWPYEDNFFTRITADNILEHVGQNPRTFTNIMKEMYRISQDKAEWYIAIPQHRSDLFWDDYTHVRPLTVKTFKMFDQTYNFSCIQQKLSDSTYGIYHSMDLEIVDVKYIINKYWLDLRDQGMLGNMQLDINLNTLANVCESINIFIKVHKPGRCQDMIDKMKK